jgi:predicted membrane protein
VSAGVVVAGLAVMLFGARARRPVAVAGAAGVAAVAAQWMGTRAGALLGMPPSTLAAVAAAATGAVAALVPHVFPALAGAFPGALLAELFAPADRKLEVLAAGAILGGVLGVLAARPVAAVVASGAGALAVAVGAAGALRGTAPGRALLAHPSAILAAAAILAVAGTAFQYSRAWGRGGEGPARKPPPAPVKGD